MDTSETYIKMCDCPEIQGWKMFKYNDIHSQHSQKDFVSFSHTKPNVWENIVWLPRQDQIQEMLIEKNRIADLKNRFNSFISLVGWHNGDGTYTDRVNEKFKFESFEQLWLAFYVHEKHGKLWDGEKWIKK